MSTRTVVLEKPVRKHGVRKAMWREAWGLQTHEAGVGGRDRGHFSET